jgi:hypothetical protein
MTLLSIVTVVLAAAIMGYLGLGRSSHVTADVEVENPRPVSIPKRWSTLLIAVTVVYFFLLLAGLSYAGWFRVA